MGFNYEGNRYDRAASCEEVLSRGDIVMMLTDIMIDRVDDVTVGHPVYCRYIIRSNNVEAMTRLSTVMSEKQPSKTKTKWDIVA